MQDGIWVRIVGIIVRYVAMKDEGQDEGGGAVADNEGVDMGWDWPERHCVWLRSAWASWGRLK